MQAQGCYRSNPRHGNTPLLREDRRVILKCLGNGQHRLDHPQLCTAYCHLRSRSTGIAVVVAVDLIVVQPLVDEDVHGVLRFLSQDLADEFFRLIHRRRRWIILIVQAFFIEL